MGRGCRRFDMLHICMKAHLSGAACLPRVRSNSARAGGRRAASAVAPLRRISSSMRIFHVPMKCSRDALKYVARKSGSSALERGAILRTSHSLRSRAATRCAAAICAAVQEVASSTGGRLYTGAAGLLLRCSTCASSARPPGAVCAAEGCATAASSCVRCEGRRAVFDTVGGGVLVPPLPAALGASRSASTTNADATCAGAGSASL